MLEEWNGRASDRSLGQPSATNRRPSRPYICPVWRPCRGLEDCSRVRRQVFWWTQRPGTLLFRESVQQVFIRRSSIAVMICMVALVLSMCSLALIRLSGRLYVALWLWYQGACSHCLLATAYNGVEVFKLVKPYNRLADTILLHLIWHPYGETVPGDLIDALLMVV